MANQESIAGQVVSPAADKTKNWLIPDAQHETARHNGVLNSAALSKELCPHTRPDDVKRQVSVGLGQVSQDQKHTPSYTKLCLYLYDDTRIPNVPFLPSPWLHDGKADASRLERLWGARSW
eukprot:4508430-Amphidinium_carterae.1